MKRIFFTFGILWVLLLSQGCSVYMAGNQPAKVDMAAFESTAIPRDVVIAKLGVPITSTKNEDGTRTDIYEFYAGSAKGWKAGRATFNAVADVFTIGLWEVVATPTEMAIKGDKIIARAVFDKNDVLKEFVVPKVQKRETAEVSKGPDPDPK